MAKKVNEKDVAKATVMKVVVDALATAGYQVSEGSEYGMTSGTIVVHAGACDVQIKPITPKAGVTRYEVAEE